MTLLGQTVNSYHDGTHDFADLLRAVGAVDGIRRVRFTSPYPTDFTDRVIEAMADGPGGLRARPPAGAERLERRAPADAAALHPRAVPRRGGAAPGGDSRASPSRPTSSSASPGETEAQFEETLSLVEEAGFDDAYTFQYSVRDGTPAVRLQDHVADEVARRAAGAAHRAGPRPGPAQEHGPGREHGTRCWSSGRPGAATCCSAAPAPISWCWSTCPPTAIGEYHQVRLTGTTGSTFTGPVVRPQLAGARMTVQAIHNLGRRSRRRGLRPSWSSHFPDFCGCDICRHDVLVYALNRLPPRYVDGLEGSVVTDVNLDKDQNRAAIDVAIMEGIRKVNLAPRCDGAAEVAAPPRPSPGLPDAGTR